MLQKLAQHRWLVGSTLTNYVTYSCWTLLNKWQFERVGTDCPVLSTALQMLIAGFIACAVSLVIFGRVSSAMSQRGGAWWKVLTQQILPLGIARSVDIGCGNTALTLVSVALQQILKSLLPLFVCVLSLMILRKNSSLLVWLSLVPIVFGSFLSALAPSNAKTAVSMFGVFLALVSTFGRSLKAVLNSLLVSGSSQNLPLSPLEVLALEAPTSGVILLTVDALHRLIKSASSSPSHAVAAADVSSSSMFSSSSKLCSADASMFVVVNVAAGVLMFFNQLSYISVIKFSSALTCQVLMNMKMLLLILVSLFVFHTQLSLTNAFGMFVAFCGCMLYSAASMVPPPRKKEDDVVV